jgi:hypothetical protein
MLTGGVMGKWITRKWSILGSLFVTWAVFTAVYAAWFVVVPQGATAAFEITKFVFLSISAFGVLFSTLLTSFNSLEASQSLQDRINFDRTENAFEYLRRWDSQSLKEARDWTRKVGRDHSKRSPDKLCGLIEGDEDLQRSVITMVNFFEEIELSVQAGRVNADILKQGLACAYIGYSGCIGIYDRFRPWVDKYSDSSQQAYLRDLYKRWT